MLSKLSSLSAWLIADPRRMMVILFVILLTVMVVSALVPGTQVLAGEASSGS